MNLHVAPGLANALSIVHNASRAKTPLLVTAGQQDSRLLLDAPILAGDMVKMTEGLTKWSYELRHASEAPSASRAPLRKTYAPSMLSGRFRNTETWQADRTRWASSSMRSRSWPAATHGRSAWQLTLP